jgi:hypothetical protein
MIFAVIKNNLVINTIVADQDFVDKVYPDAVKCNNSVGIGWIWDGTNFIVPAPNIKEIPNE